VCTPLSRTENCTKEAQQVAQSFLRPKANQIKDYSHSFLFAIG